MGELAELLDVDAIPAFAGEQVDLVVVEPDAHAVLADYDPRVHHIELREEGERAVGLGPNPAFVVPRGAVYRTCAPGRTAVLMVETAGAVPTGD